VGETVDLSVLCPDDKKTRIDVNISLDDIKCKKPKKNFNVIKLNETIGVVMKYPTLRMKVDEKDGFRIVAECIESIYDEDTVYATADFSKDELDTFIDSMTQSQLEMVSDFLDGIPKVYKDIEVTNPKTKVKSKMRLEGMETFF
jgi:hypothetical protein